MTDNSFLSLIRNTRKIEGQPKPPSKWRKGDRYYNPQHCTTHTLTEKTAKYFNKEGIKPINYYKNPIEITWLPQRKKMKTTIEELDELLFTKQTIEIDNRSFRVPRCQICKKPMSPAVDSINNKLTGYSWKCDCPIGKKYRLMIG